MMRAVKCSNLRITAKGKAGRIPGVATFNSSFYHTFPAFRHGFSSSTARYQQYTRQPLYNLGLGLGFKYGTPLCGLLRKAAVTRRFTVDAKPETSDDPLLQSGDSKAITTVCGILTKKAWCLETEGALMSHLSSINVHVVVKVIKSVPVGEAVRFFQWLRSQGGFQHDFSTYHAVIDTLGEARCFDKMREFVAEMREAGCTMRAMLYRDVIYWCACAGDFEGVMSYWEDLKKDQIKPSASLWTALIDVHAKAKKYDVAVTLYSDMVEAGLTPNPRTLSIFIDHLVDLGKLDAADSIVDKMQELDMFPSMSSYARLMAAHAKVGNVVMLKRMGKHLRYTCNRPGHMFCNAVKAMYEGGMYKEALLFGREVWPELSSQEIMEKVGSSFQPKEEADVSSTENLADDDLGSRVAETDTCIETRQSLSHIHMEKILKSWNLSSMSLLKQAKINWSNELIYELLSRRIQKPQIAWSLFCWLKSEAGVCHDVFNQITMLRILSRNNFFSPLVSLLTEMQEEGVKLSITTFNFILKDFGLAKNAHAASWVFNFIKEFGLEPNQESFTALMDAYSRAKCYEDALSLLERMHQAGYVLEASSCILLIGTLSLAGKADKAHSVFQMFLNSGGNPNVQCFTALIKAHCHSGNTELALQTFTNMTQVGIAPLPDTLWTMAWVYLQIGDLEKFQECVRPPHETLSQQQKLLICHKESLMAVKTILVKSFIQERVISLCESDL